MTRPEQLIQWHQLGDDDHPGNGHGVVVFDFARRDSQRDIVVMYIHGYSYSHAVEMGWKLPFQAWHIKPDEITTAAMIEDAKKRIEALMLERMPDIDEHLTNRLYLHMNC